MKCYAYFKKKNEGTKFYYSAVLKILDYQIRIIF